MTEDTYLYLDNAAATALDPRVYEAMDPYWHEHSANAGALHREGVLVHRVTEDAREMIATVLQALPDEIIFTSGGTESNNLAIQGVVRAQLKAGKKVEDIHLVTSTIEHSSVLDCFRALEAEGVRVTLVPVDTEGFLDLDALEEALTAETVLVSIMYANNEIGTIERIADIARVIRRAREKHGTHILFHTDASQAPAWLTCAVPSLGVDLLTLDAQKIYGPKGVGCLYRKREVALEPLMYGGKQEFGLRPGTPPTPLIVGFAKALELVEAERDTYQATIATLRDTAIHTILNACPEALLNGAMGSERLANNINISFPGLDGEQIVLELDARGIAVSTRSACMRDTTPGSYMVAALGKGSAYATSSVRISFSRHTTREEAERVSRALVEVVRWLRRNAQ